MRYALNGPLGIFGESIDVFVNQFQVMGHSSRKYQIGTSMPTRVSTKDAVAVTEIHH